MTMAITIESTGNYPSMSLEEVLKQKNSIIDSIMKKIENMIIHWRGCEATLFQEEIQFSEPATHTSIYIHWQGGLFSLPYFMLGIAPVDKTKTDSGLKYTHLISCSFTFSSSTKLTEDNLAKVYSQITKPTTLFPEADASIFVLTLHKVSLRRLEEINTFLDIFNQKITEYITSKLIGTSAPTLTEAIADNIRKNGWEDPSVPQVVPESKGISSAELEELDNAACRSLDEIIKLYEEKLAVKDKEIEELKKVIKGMK